MNLSRRGFFGAFMAAPLAPSLAEVQQTRQEIARLREEFTALRAELEKPIVVSVTIDTPSVGRQTDQISRELTRRMKEGRHAITSFAQ